MSGLAHQSPGVSVVRLDGPTYLSGGPGRRRDPSGERSYVRLVASLVLAATGLAFFDLYQLISLIVR